MMWRALALCLALVAGFSGQAVAQQEQAPPAVLTLNQERLYASSLFGQRVRDDLEAASVVLATENRQIESALVAEEAQLVEDRATLDPAEFRKLAEEFDERVTGIRRAQVEKREALQRAADAERLRFFDMAFPVLFELVDDFGALAILNQNAVILSSRAIDVTDRAIARVDAAFGASPPKPAAPAKPMPRPNADGPEDGAQTQSQESSE